MPDPYNMNNIPIPIQWLIKPVRNKTDDQKDDRRESYDHCGNRCRITQSIGRKTVKDKYRSGHRMVDQNDDSTKFTQTTAPHHQSTVYNIFSGIGDRDSKKDPEWVGSQCSGNLFKFWVYFSETVFGSVN